MTAEFASQIRVIAIPTNHPDQPKVGNMGVEIEHMPTGTKVQSIEYRTGIKNYKEALKMLVVSLKEKGIDISAQMILR
jgi:hypothetical protein